MQCRDIIERSGKIILRNLNVNSTNTASDKWVSGTGYGFYYVPYEKKLERDRRYYFRFTYKYTTTNQSPIWCILHIQSGMNGACSVVMPKPGVEATGSAIASPLMRYTVSSGTIYNGPSNHISGVTSYAKNVIVYDITELEQALKAGGVSDIKGWCDKNLKYVPRYTDYDVTTLIPKKTNTVQINKGTVVVDEIIETEGMQIFSQTSHPYFDSGSGVGIYNNYGNGTVTHQRISALSQDSPFKGEHPYILKITTNGSATPGTGGFYATHWAGANKRFVEKFVAKIPVGYTVNWHCNPQGDGASINFIGPHVGTGKWEEYTIYYQCGPSGSFSSGGHVALEAQSGYSNTSVTWYVAYVANCEVTGREHLRFYSALNPFAANKGMLSVTNLSNNLIINSRGRKQGTRYKWDTTDVAGNANASIVQDIGASGPFTEWMRVDPTCRYKISYWVKCKRDMNYFLTAVHIRTESGRELIHGDVNYDYGTRTTLAKQLNPGDTTVTLESGANWSVRDYSSLGFRSWYCSYNDQGRFGNHVISAVNGNVLTLKQAYSGPVRNVGQYVVESYDGGTYPYPIYKDNLPTDNTWKYVEGYFGEDRTIGWDGEGGGWRALPADCNEIAIHLNIYNNDGSVPIKYCDLRVEKVSGDGTNNMSNVIID